MMVPTTTEISRQRVDRRFTELDGLRGLAALWVVVFHYTSGTVVWLKGSALELDQISPFRTNIEGLAAVDLFFMISGFVIFMSVDSARSVWDFAAARFARLYPVIWVCVTLTTATALLMPFPMQTIDLGEYIANMSMLQSYIRIPSIETVYWSLGYELGFYALMAVLLTFRQLQRIEFIGFAWVVIAILAYRIFPAIGWHIPYRLQSFLALDKAELFFAGILFFRIYERGITWQRCGLLLLCFCGYVSGLYMPYPIFLTAFFLLFFLSIGNRAPWLRWRPLTYLGAISFPLYMIHASVGIRLQVALATLGWPPWAILAAATAFAIALAHLIHKVAELPGKRLLRSWLRPLGPQLRQAD